MVTEDRLKKIGEWMLGHDTGVSSECIAAVLLGAEPEEVRSLSRWGDTHPSDPSDFGRCLRLVRFLDCYDELERMRGVSKQWDAVVTNWNLWAKLYDDEVSSGSGPKLFAEMNRAFAS